MKNTTLTKLAMSASALCLGANMAAADIVQNDDVIITFSLCVGNDCSNGESFGFDTIRMKENNIRLHFDDTSTSASFPQNDWRIVANDSSNGGDNYLAFEDATAGRIPFRVEAGAPANTLYVEADGDVGIKTSNPIVDIHVVEGNTPTLRLEQDGSDGFAPQTYDIAANESNFFIRDVTNGSNLFFRAKPGAPEDSLFIAADGDIGIGTDGPQTDFHIRTSETFTSLRLTATGASPTESVDMTFTDGGADGSLRYNFDDGDGNEFDLNNDGNLTLTSSETFNTFRIAASGASPNTGADLTFTDAGASGQFRVNIDAGDAQEMSLDDAGNMVITGTLTQGSDRNNKIGIVPVDSDEILEKVSALPVSTWTYKGDADTGVYHIGPMAQDFYAAFGTGHTDKGISSIDAAGVALAAIQSLTQREAELKARVAKLEAMLSE
ncbi:tail fiber domain-containing protein [uncultured Litoreibacter sp.]|uniref:tail fiber domain-containing protein n=1 Tax=uncultured Litoreibacter sp. TaxID=1392394 RepID=UPI0026221B5E|nr:tail fiber domain-containing protein [uncultured Litoreibacter sp.]